MKKKSLFAGLLIALLLAGMAGCGTPAESPGAVSNTDGATAEAPKIAILIPSAPTDGGWGEIGATGIEFAAKELGCKPVVVEAATADLMKSEAEALAADGFNVIFGHGGQYASPFSEIADNYPDTLFITHGGDIVKDNMMPLSFSQEQLNYIQGAIAAMLTKTNTLGAIIGGDFPTYRVASRSFEQGARSVNPDIEVLVGVTQDASDMNEGYELTMSQIKAGADVVLLDANQASLGGVTAAKESNVYLMPVISDLQKEAPDQVVASVCQDYGPAMVKITRDFLEGKTEAGVITVGVADGALIWVWGDKVKETLPADVIALYQDTLDKIFAGEIEIPNEREGW